MSHVRILVPVLLVALASDACTRRCEGPCCVEGKIADESVLCSRWSEYDPIAGCGVTVPGIDWAQYCSGYSALCTGRIEHAPATPIECTASQVATTDASGARCACDLSCCGDGETCSDTGECCAPQCGPFDCATHTVQCGNGHAAVDCGGCGAYAQCSPYGGCSCRVQWCPGGCCGPDESCTAPGTCGVSLRIESVTTTQATLTSVSAGATDIALSGTGRPGQSLGALDLTPAVGPGGSFVARGTSDGALAWVRGMPSADGVQVAIASNGDFLGVGYVPASTTDVVIGAGAAAPVSVPASSTGSIVLARFGADGEVARVTIAASGAAVVDTTRLAALPDGSCVIAAQVAGGAVIVAAGQTTETTLAPPPGSWGLLLVRFDQAGDLSWAQMIGSAAGDTILRDLAASPSGGFAIAAQSTGAVTVGMGPTAMTAAATGYDRGWFAELSASDAPAWVCESGLYNDAQGVAGGPDGSFALSFSGYSPLTCANPGAAGSTYDMRGGQYGVYLARVNAAGAVENAYAQLISPLFAFDPTGRLVLVTGSLVLYVDSSDLDWRVNGLSLALYGGDLGLPLAAKELVASDYTNASVTAVAVTGDGRAVVLGSANGTIAPGQPFEETTVAQFVMTVALPPP